MATGYPLLDVFLSILYLTLLFFWLVLIFHIMWDIMRSSDMNGWVKALWVICILVLPLLGALIYLIARGNAMGERDLKESQDQQKTFEDYIRQVAHSKDDSEPQPHA